MSHGWITGLVVIGICAARPAFGDPDYENGKDVYVTRLAGFYIQECTDKKFDAYTFAEGTPNEKRVEGRLVDTFYRVDEGKEEPSPLSVRRNFENVLKQAGWTVVNADPDTLTAMQVKGGEERCFQLMGNGGASYELITACKAEMEQSVITADGMLTALTQNGRVAL